MFFGDGAHGSANAFRLAAIKPRRFNFVFEFSLPRVRIILGSPIFLEERGRDHIHPLVRALRRKDRRYKQLERVPKVQLAMRIWVNFRPGFHKLSNALSSCHLVIILQACYGFQR